MQNLEMIQLNIYLKKKRKKLNSTIVILFNHDSKFKIRFL